MSAYKFSLAGAMLEARGSGALYWPERRLLVVSDLHLGKSNRYAQLGGASLPPYETRDTLTRLDSELELTGAQTLVCLGDSFDDRSAALSLTDGEKLWITRLQAGRRWVWIEGNHDPGPVDLGGTHLAALPMGPLIFRHIAQPGQSGELSGHYHPKAKVRIRSRTVTRPCFLIDGDRVILPAFGTYTGGLRSHEDILSRLMRPEAIAVMTGPNPQAVPMPRG